MIWLKLSFVSKSYGGLKTRFEEREKEEQERAEKQALAQQVEEPTPVAQDWMATTTEVDPNFVPAQATTDAAFVMPEPTVADNWGGPGQPQGGQDWGMEQ